MSSHPILSTAANRMLEAFASRFAASAQRGGGRKVRIAEWGEYLPAINSDARERIAFLNALEHLARIGVVSVKWKKFRRGEEPEAVYLENPDQLFSLLGRVHPDELTVSAIAEADYAPDCSPVSRAVLDYCAELAASRRSLPVTDPADLKNIIRLIDYVHRDGVNLPIRAISVLLFNDSKRVERLIASARDLVKRAGYEGFLDAIHRSYPECMIKGDLQIEFSDGRIWKLSDSPVSISLQGIGEVVRIMDGSGRSRPLLSIENKETFYSMHDPDRFAGYIFTSGHPGEAAAALIRVVSESGFELFHFGDMDPDGILIYQTVERICNGRCSPYLMSEEIYREYLEYGYELDAVRLSRIPVDGGKLAAVCNALRLHGRGVEQELIDWR